MDRIRLITHEDIPWWYELGWLADSTHGPAITIRIRKEALNPLYLGKSHLTDHLSKEFSLPDFQELGGDTFGFGGCMKWVAEDTVSRTLLVPIPTVESFTDGKCRDCGGNAKHPYHEDESCYSCHGTGKGRSLEWKLARAISASFTVLFQGLEFHNVTWKDTLKQLLTVTTITQEGMHGGSLGGRYSVCMVKWLASHPKGTSLTPMVEAMKNAHWKMFLKREHSYMDRFSANVDHSDGWLNVNCPGDACGLNPNHSGPRPGEGYDWSCHNVDSPMQQLTLLAGLAALHKQARQEGVR